MFIQKLEYILKYLIVYGKISAPISQLKKKFKQANTQIKNQTMGQVTTQYLNNINPNSQDSTKDTDVIVEPFISFDILHDSEYFERKKTTLTKIVEERNYLVHHLYPDFDMLCIESCQRIESQLDIQYNNIQSEIEDLKFIIVSMENQKKILLDYIQSDEYKNELLSSWLKQTPLILLLVNISMQIAREDGWSQLSEAGRLLREQDPEEMIKLEEKYGHKTLKPIILESGIFDLYVEEGKNNTLYKVKQDIKLWSVT